MTTGATTTYRLELPWYRPPLTANQRLHWSVRARKTREMRHAAAWLAKAHRIPPGHLTVGLEWAPGDRRRRDGGENLAPTLKPLIDGLALDAALVPDDTPQHVERLMPVILPPPHPPGLWLTVEVTA